MSSKERKEWHLVDWFKNKKSEKIPFHVKEKEKEKGLQIVYSNHNKKTRTHFDDIEKKYPDNARTYEQFPAAVAFTLDNSEGKG